MGIIFCIEHFLKFITPTIIIVTGIAIKISKIIVIVIEQKKNVPSFFISRNVPLVVSLAYSTLLNIAEAFGLSARFMKIKHYKRI